MSQSISKNLPPTNDPVLASVSGWANPCLSCKWRLDKNDNGNTCIRGAAPLYAKHIGRCAKHEPYSPNYQAHLPAKTGGEQKQKGTK